MLSSEKRKKAAVFLDRDGVINFEDGDYNYDVDFFKINDGVYEALKIFIERGYLLIVITNQSDKFDRPVECI